MSEKPPNRPAARRDGRTGSLRNRLDRPLLGLDVVRTAIGLQLLGAVCGLYLVSALGTVGLANGRLHGYATAFDTLSTALILLGALVSVVGPFAYAVWNGGPVVAFAIGLVPELVGELLARRWVLDLDLAVGLTAGASGAAVALAVTASRTDGDGGRPLVPRPPRHQALVVGVLLAGSAGATVRFVFQAPASVLAAYRPFALLWAVPVAVVALFAVAQGRHTD